MKLGILTALWGRPNITYLFLDRLMHLQNKYGVIGACVGTNNEFRASCEMREILYTDYKNKPLGEKWNHGMKMFRDTDVTHVMILGSDDLVSDDFMEYSLDFAKDKDFCGCKDLYMYGANPSRRGWMGLYYFRYRGYLIGPGRCYSRSVIEQLDYELWSPTKNYGLDGSVVKRIKTLGPDVRRGSFFMQDEGLFVIDIKTRGNISGIPGGAKLLDEPLKDLLLKHLPEDEVKNIITAVQG